MREMRNARLGEKQQVHDRGDTKHEKGDGCQSSKSLSLHESLSNERLLSRDLPGLRLASNEF